MSSTESLFLQLPLYNIFNITDIRQLNDATSITLLAKIDIYNTNAFSFSNGKENYRIMWLPLEGYLVFALYEEENLIHSVNYIIHEIEYFFYDITKLGERGTLIIEVIPFSDNASCNIYLTGSGTSVVI